MNKIATYIVRLIDVSAHWMAHISGWRRLLFSALLGAVTTLSLPPAHFVVIMFLTFPGLLWLLDGVKSHWTAFWVGWSFGFGYFVFGLYWIGFAFLIHLESLKWFLPIAVTGLPAYLALYSGLATLIFSLLKLHGIGRCLSFAVLWAGSEWLRGYLLTGFPWNLIGSVWSDFPAMLQIVSVTGIYGLSLITVALVSLPAILACQSRCGVPYSQAIGSLVIGLVLAGSITIAGMIRLSGAQDHVVPDIRLRLIQPNIQQKVSLTPEERGQIFWYLIGLTNGELAVDTVLESHRGEDPIDEDRASSSQRLITIWPEAAVPFPVESFPRAIEAIANVTPENGVSIVGTTRIILDSQRQRRYYNGLVIIDTQGRVVESYNKSHLVPFGEYLPARSMFPSWLPIQSVATGTIDFTAGPGLQTLHLSNIPPFGSLICYEVIFPGEVVNSDDRPQWLVNITNDAWYRISAGPYQHFSSAVIRAVEEGLPVIRVATTGISGIIDAYGRTHVALKLGTSGIIEADLPVGIDDVTIYGQQGDKIFFAMLTILALLSYSLGFSSKRKER